MLRSYWLNGRAARRLLVLSSLAMLLALVFGASMVLAQGLVFMPWSAHTNGGEDLTSLENKMRAVTFGQSALGVTTSDDFQLELGFHTGVRAGPAAFAALAAELALTPTPTPEPAATDTPTAEPTTETAESTETPTAQTETPEAAPTEIPTAVPTVRPATATATRPPRPSATTVPSATATSEPIVIVVTSPPRPSPTPEPPPPAATAVPPTPLVIVVTSVPPSTPAVPESPVGGLCSAPGSYGPLPLDLGLLMILAAPFALWRLSSRSQPAEHVGLLCKKRRRRVV